MRDYSRFDAYLDRLLQDVYAQPPDAGHLAWGEEAVRTLFSIPQDVHSVLDVGCGQGQFKPVLESMGLKWTGVVMGEDYFACAQQGVDVHRADMSFLPFPDACFDLVFARHVLEHSPFPVITLMEWRRVCRGWMGLVLPAPDYWGVRGRNHYAILPMDNWLWLLARAGWRPIHQRTMMTSEAIFRLGYTGQLPDPPLEVEYRFLCERIEEALE